MAGVKNKMQRLASAARGRQYALQARPAAFESRGKDTVVEEARRPVGALLQLYEQRRIACQVDLLQVDVG